jgi:predicted thioesterase
MRDRMEDFNLKTGTLGEARSKVTEENTALKFGSGSVSVFATPAMIGLMEKASINCVDRYLPDGFASVGTKVDIKHIAATPVGMEVIAEAELIEVDGRKLKFKVSAYDGNEKIGEGTHSRYIVELDDFIDRASKKIV